MRLRTTLAALSAVVLAAAAYAPTAKADRVGFNVTFGGPGYAFNVGNYGYGHYGYPYYAAPVVVAPYAPYYRPYRPYRAYNYAPAPVVVRPYPVYRPYDGWRHGGGYRHYDRPGYYASHYNYYDYRR